MQEQGIFVLFWGVTYSYAYKLYKYELSTREHSRLFYFPKYEMKRNKEDSNLWAEVKSLNVRKRKINLVYLSWQNVEG